MFIALFKFRDDFADVNLRVYKLIIFVRVLIITCRKMAFE